MSLSSRSAFTGVGLAYLMRLITEVTPGADQAARSASFPMVTGSRLQTAGRAGETRSPGGGDLTAGAARAPAGGVELAVDVAPCGDSTRTCLGRLTPTTTCGRPGARRAVSSARRSNRSRENWPDDLRRAGTRAAPMGRRRAGVQDLTSSSCVDIHLAAEGWMRIPSACMPVHGSWTTVLNACPSPIRQLATTWRGPPKCGSSAPR
jgi:hypothetical protein